MNKHFTEFTRKIRGNRVRLFEEYPDGESILMMVVICIVVFVWVIADIISTYIR